MAYFEKNRNTINLAVIANRKTLILILDKQIGSVWINKTHVSRKRKLVLLRERVFRYTLLSYGGDKRDRTADLLNAIQALSQLSYTPKCGECTIFS